MSEASSDYGSVVPDGEMALVTENGRQGLQMLLPPVPGETIMSDVAMYLLACFTRYHDDSEFVAEQIAWIVEYRDDTR